MPLKSDLIEEINLLLNFSLESTQQGLKVHHDARAEVVQATRRLFDKGLISQVDGGYLTLLGQETAEHAHKVLRVLSSSSMHH